MQHLIQVFRFLFFPPFAVLPTVHVQCCKPIQLLKNPNVDCGFTSLAFSQELKIPVKNWEKLATLNFFSQNCLSLSLLACAVFEQINMRFAGQ